GEQFQVSNETEWELHFEEFINEVPLFSSGPMEIKVDEKGNLVLFAFYGHFPSKELVQEETYKLSLDAVENIAKEQLKYIEFPEDEQEKLIPIYAIEETLIKNDQTATIPHGPFLDGKPYYEMNQTVHWEHPIHEPFKKVE